MICWAPPSLRIYVCIFCDCIQNILVQAELPPAGFILFYYFISCYYAGPTEGAARPPSHRGRSAPPSSLVLTAAAAAASVSASVSAVPAVFPVPAAPCPPSRSSTATTASWPMPPRRRGRCGGEAACGAWPGLAAPGARVAPRAGPGSSALREGVAGVVVKGSCRSWTGEREGVRGGSASLPPYERASPPQEALGVKSRHDLPHSSTSTKFIKHGDAHVSSSKMFSVFKTNSLIA